MTIFANIAAGLVTVLMMRVNALCVMAMGRKIMSKRDIKAKRWGRKSAKRQMAVEPVIVDGFPSEQSLKFLTQVRMLGDGRWQYREWVLLRRFSLKLRRRGLNRQEWRDC